MKKIFITILVAAIITSPALAANPTCQKAKNLEQLVKQTRNEVAELQNQFAPWASLCPDIPSSKSNEASTPWLRKFLDSHKYLMIKNELIKFPHDIADAIEEYFELLSSLDDLSGKAKRCDTFGSFKSELSLSLEFHEEITENVIPRGFEVLKNSNSTLTTTKEGATWSKKIIPELKKQNLRLCSDADAQEEGGLKNMDSSTGSFMGEQNKGEKEARKAPNIINALDVPPRPEQGSASALFKRALIAAQPEAELPYSFPPEDGEAPYYKTMVDAEVEKKTDWWGFGQILENYVRMFFKEDPTGANIGFYDIRTQETEFRTRQEKRENYKNYIRHRAKDISGIRTDRFAKELKYTFDQIMSINNELGNAKSNTILFKNIVCEHQDEPTVCPQHPKCLLCESNPGD